MNANTINSKNVISGVNDLATKCPKISAMWSAKNTYTPSEVSVGSNKKAFWKNQKLVLTALANGIE